MYYPYDIRDSWGSATIRDLAKRLPLVVRNKSGRWNPVCKVSCIYPACSPRTVAARLACPKATGAVARRRLHRYERMAMMLRLVWTRLEEMNLSRSTPRLSDSRARRAWPTLHIISYDIMRTCRDVVCTETLRPTWDRLSTSRKLW